MRSFGKWLGRALVLLLLIFGVFHILPREQVDWAPLAADLSDPEAYLAAREAAVDDLRPGNEARIVWADARGQRTDLVVLYLHGFSAGPEEIRPVPDRVAEAFGANLVFARLAGHGQSGASLGAARAGDWVADTELFLRVARALGDRILIIGTSTGGTLAAYAATEPNMADAIAGIAFVSPNIRLTNPAGVLLEWPMARTWVPWIVGAERSFDVQSEAHGAHWTSAYPSVAAVSLGTLMRETRDRDVTGVSLPALFLFADEDQVVSADAARAFAQAWGGPVTLAAQTLPEEGADPYRHVIAGEILSPAMTDAVVAEIVAWWEDAAE